MKMYLWKYCSVVQSNNRVMHVIAIFITDSKVFHVDASCSVNTWVLALL